MMETGGDRVAPGRSAIAWANPRQHPLGEKPSISVMFADPSSVEGSGGGQMVERVFGAAAVALAERCPVLLRDQTQQPCFCGRLFGRSPVPQLGVVMPRKMIATRIVRCISRSPASRQS